MTLVMYLLYTVSYIVCENDASMFSDGKNPDGLVNTVNNELKNAPLNLGKTQFMLFCPEHKSLALNKFVCMNNCTIQRVPYLSNFGA